MHALRIVESSVSSIGLYAPCMQPNVQQRLSIDPPPLTPPLPLPPPPPSPSPPLPPPHLQPKAARKMSTPETHAGIKHLKNNHTGHCRHKLNYYFCVIIYIIDYFYYYYFLRSWLKEIDFEERDTSIIRVVQCRKPVFYHFRKN